MRNLLLISLFACAFAGSAAAQLIDRSYRIERFATSTPFIVGGVRIDPEQLLIAETPIGFGDVLASGPGYYFETAALTAPTGISDGLVPRIAPVGTPIHRVEFLQQTPSGMFVMRFWCGALGAEHDAGTWIRPYCTVLSNRGLVGVQMGGIGWLATAPTFNVSNDRRYDQFEFQPTAPTGQPDMQVRFRLIRGLRGRIILRMEAERGGEVVPMLTIERDPADGDAVFPMWTHTLRIRMVSRGRATAELTPDGDGVGLAEVGQYVRR